VLPLCILWGLAFGALEVSYFTRTNQVFPLGSGHLLLWLLLGAAHFIIAGVGALAATAISRVGQRTAARLVGVPVVLFLLLSLSHYRDRINTRPRSVEGTLITLAIIAAFAVAFFLLRHAASRSLRAAQRTLLVGGGLILIGSLTWLFTLRPDMRFDSSLRLRQQLEAGGTLFEPTESVTAKMVGYDDTGLRILLIPLDGGTWKVIDPLIQAGRMPNLESLMRHGTSATLESDIPTFSPIIWTSVSTGKYPTRHGIHGFIRTDLPLGLPQMRLETIRMAALTKVLKTGTRVYEVLGHQWPALALPVEIYSSNDIQARQLWEIMGEFGLQSIILEWYIGHPAQPINGVQVSERFHLMKGLAANIPNIVYPDSLASLLEEAVVAPEELDERLLLSLIETKGLDEAGIRAFMEENASWFDIVRKNMARDVSTAQLTDAVFPYVPEWRFAATYFRAMDALHHYTWNLRDLPGEGFSDHPERRFYDAIERYHEFCDGIVGRVVQHADDNTIVIVMSDHGFEDRYDHERGPEGFFVMAGGPVQHIEERQRISVYDIAPTILALQGIPVPQDMDGEVSTSLVPPSFWVDHPVRHVPSYEARGEQNSVEATSDMDEEVLDRLRALGYIR
jgi:predicted AlkP superfamily phosphohydrolase/phosphomutase